MIHKNQKINHNINVKVKFKTCRHTNLHSSWLHYSTMEMYQVYHVFLKNIRHKHSYKKIQLILKTIKDYIITEKITILED